MKTKTFLLTVITLAFLLGATGCERGKEPKFEIYENHEVSACGIKDPLKNIKPVPSDMSDK